MSIYRTNPAPFIKTDSAIFFDRTIPQTCREIHSLAIDLLKIPGWIIRKKYIADQLQVSLRTVNRYFNLLVKRGLAYYDEIKHRWHVFRTPKPNNNGTLTEGGLPLVVEGGLPDLAPINQIQGYEEEKQQREPMPEQEKTVVVLEEENSSTLEFPVQLKPEQKKAAKSRIKNAPLDLQQAILSCLARYMIQGTVKNPVAYLNTLITAANNGTFEVVGVATAKKIYYADNDSTQAEIKARQQRKVPDKEKRPSILSGLKAALRN